MKNTTLLFLLSVISTHKIYNSAYQQSISDHMQINKKMFVELVNMY